MFGLGKGLDPKKMQAMMKQLGIKQEEVEALRVVIEKPDGQIVIANPSVQKVEMQGQTTWQIAGEAREETDEGISDSDVKLIMEKTGKDEKEVREVLEETKDIAEAILKLQS